MCRRKINWQDFSSGKISVKYLFRPSDGVYSLFRAAVQQITEADEPGATKAVSLDSGTMPGINNFSGFFWRLRILRIRSPLTAYDHQYVIG